jgi:2'-5' RNA ligase
MRLFVAVEFSPEILGKLSQAQAALPKEGLTLVKPENQHLTLKFLGEVEEAKLDALKAALDSCARPPFAISVKRVGVFPNEKFVRVVWAGVESKELGVLAGEVENALAKIGFPKEGRPFAAHATLARAKAKVDVRAFLEKFKGFDFGSCQISKFILKKSTLTPKGPVYEDVHSVLLK